MPSADDFQEHLSRIFNERTNAGATALTLVSGELHREIGGYPGTNHSMPICCAVMRQNMRLGDAILEQPPKGNGATLKIRYNLPR
jgi:5-methylcytosine-specific restriction protein A